MCNVGPQNKFLRANYGLLLAGLLDEDCAYLAQLGLELWRGFRFDLAMT